MLRQEEKEEEEESNRNSCFKNEGKERIDGNRSIGV